MISTVFFAGYPGIPDIVSMCRWLPEKRRTYAHLHNPKLLSSRDSIWSQQICTRKALTLSNSNPFLSIRSLMTFIVTTEISIMPKNKISANHIKTLLLVHTRTQQFDAMKARVSTRTGAFRRHPCLIMIGSHVIIEATLPTVYFFVRYYLATEQRAAFIDHEQLRRDSAPSRSPRPARITLR